MYPSFCIRREGHTENMSDSHQRPSWGREGYTYPTFSSHTLVFTNSLDEEEALNWTDNKDLRDFHRACWELEFLPVAQKLMKMLQSADLTA